MKTRSLKRKVLVGNGKLLPCPFCGGKATITSKLDGGIYYGIECHTVSCHLITDTPYLGDSKKEVIRKWNTRAPKKVGGKR